MGRGRPPLEDIPPPRKFTREYRDEDGSVSTWHYDLDKFPNGPFKVDITAPVIKETWEEKTLDNQKLSVSTLILLIINGLVTAELSN